MTHYSGYIGTYTKGDSKGVYGFTLNTETGEITDIKAEAQLGNPTYVTVSADHQYLYAVKKDGDMGGVAGYSITGDTNGLSHLKSQVTEGASPCHVSVDSKNKHVVTANYHRGTVELFAVDNEEGGIQPVASVAQLEGNGPHERQEKPHTHYAGFTPDEKYIVAVDLGIDQIITYDYSNDTLKEVHTLHVKPGSGPRHITFHPNGKYAYVMTEISSEVIVLSYNEEDGSFQVLQTISTIPEDFTENNQGSAIHISADGCFVYAGNRGHNSIAVFSVSDQGQLTLVDITSTEGDWPRDFALDPSQKFILAANEQSSSLVLFSRDEHTGKLSLKYKDAYVPYPVCVKFL
ncbi:hypothetical protein A374_17929 [Fictibacillus macauensis ZFHKF-1]|uniref:6-phosphogluconolactonase n=1 Tax=Fictibacillus macauensis ZFHKF-1 TaxID=1196324 RepID=I8AF03_9BACL|nr:lactonase family protein [Fictibacillus macauensis]EIT83939.1 hypothetical protein A374_17929 [Fictibacillus macauensis ZFHKF-1]